MVNNRIFYAAFLALLIAACSSVPVTAPPLEDEALSPSEDTSAVETAAEPSAALPLPVEGAPLEDAASVEGVPVEQNIVMRPDRPQRYTVQKGDTLWSVAARFLQQPWQWPEIWQRNQQINNPHLIYPGDIIRLRMADNGPQFAVERGPLATSVTVETAPTAAPSPPQRDGRRLTPQIRSTALAQAISSIPMEDIRHFFSSSRFLPAGSLAKTATVLGGPEDRLIYGRGDEIYVRGELPSNNADRFSLYRRGVALQDPRSDRTLGVHAIYLGQARLLARGDPHHLLITDSVREILKGDHLLPLLPLNQPEQIVPRQPTLSRMGEVIGLDEALSNTARNQVVFLNLGREQGLQEGDVLFVHRASALLQRQPSQKRSQEPLRRVGVLLVFASFDEVSYGLVMESQLPVRLHDQVSGTP